jgi:uncharacterized protein
MLPQTERYLALARLGRNQWWRYALSVTLILACWLVLGFMAYAWIAVLRPPDPIFDYIGVNVTIVMMLAGLVLAMRLVHRRPLRSLVTPARAVDWRRIGQGAAVWGAIGLVAAVVEHLLYPDRYYLSFNPERFVVFAAVALVLTPIQTTTEELVFRGYVMQGLGLIVRRPAAVAVISGVVFAAPHLLNPEVQQYGAGIMAASYFTIGLLLAAITLRDGRLELAIGMHAANNLLLALAANYEGSVLVTESIYTARELDPVYTLISLIAGSLAFYWVFFGRRRPAPA